MDRTVKLELIEDSNRFVRRRSFYRRVGQAWKWSYLLYGPPGTGKSGLVAAMANYLKFDVYDLELSSLRSDSELRRLLTSTKNRSIILIEDIDFAIDLENRKDGGHSPQLIGSGHLFMTSEPANFIWDAELHRWPVVELLGREDHLVYNQPQRKIRASVDKARAHGFKILASNYLGNKSHDKFNEIERPIAEVEATPAEVAEELMKNEHVETALEKVVELLGKKRGESVGIEAGGDNEEEEMEKKLESDREEEEESARGKEHAMNNDASPSDLIIMCGQN